MIPQNRNKMRHTMAASIALYMILDFSKVEMRQDPLSLDKYFESTCSYNRTQLGIDVHTRKISLGLTEKKTIEILDKLSHWH